MPAAVYCDQRHPFCKQGTTHVVDYLGDLGNILVPVLARMEPKTPVRHLGGLAPDVRSLPGNIRGGRSGKEEEIDDTTQDAVLDVPARLREPDVHAVRVEQEDTVGARVLPDLLVDEDGVGAVEVRVRRHAVCVASPERAGVVVSLDREPGISGRADVGPSGTHVKLSLCWPSP